MKESARLAVRQLDNLIDITLSSRAGVRASPTTQNRAIGLGVMGFTDVVERLGFALRERRGLRPDRRDHGVRLATHAIDASRRPRPRARRVPQLRGLAAGRRAWCRSTRSRRTEADRGVPITVDRTTRLDWDALRAKVKGGMRNATLMAIAPTASIGLVAGTTPGLDPQFSQIFSRATVLRQVPRGQPQPRARTCRTSGCGSEVQERSAARPG